MKMELALFTCFLIIVFDAIAGYIGYKANNAQNEVKHLRRSIFMYKERSENAFILGAAAAALLSLSHILANLIASYILHTQDKIKAESHALGQKLSWALFTFLWIVVGIGMTVLVLGTISNDKEKAPLDNFRPDQFLSIWLIIRNHGILDIGGFFCFLHALLAVGYITTILVVF